MLFASDALPIRIECPTHELPPLLACERLEISDPLVVFGNTRFVRGPKHDHPDARANGQSGQ